MFRSQTIVAFAFFISLLPGAAGQTNEPIQKVSFTVFAVERVLPQAIFYEASPDEFVQLTFSARNRSRRFTYEGGSPLNFYGERPVFGDDGSLIRPEPVASIALDQLYEETLLFFWQEERTPNNRNPRFRLFPMDDSEAAFPFGTFRLFNACGAPLVGQIGRERLRITTEVTEPFNVRRQLNNQQRVNMAFAIQIRDDFEMVYANQLQLSEEGRTIIVLRPPRRPGSIRVSAYMISQLPGANESEETDG
jgi:hypothetical protein